MFLASELERRGADEAVYTILRGGVVSSSGHRNVRTGDGRGEQHSTAALLAQVCSTAWISQKPAFRFTESVRSRSASESCSRGTTG